MTTMPAFRTGSDAIDNAAHMTEFAKEKFFSLADGETTYLRFVTPAEEWITVLQWGSVPTKPKPSDFTSKWPDSMPAVSRSDVAFEGMYEDDYIGDVLADQMQGYKGKRAKPYQRTWALACVREEIRGDGSDAMGGERMKGKVVGFKDKVREVIRKDDDDKEVTTVERDVVIVNMAIKNFFSKCSAIARLLNDRGDDILDRDILIKRTGAGQNDTDYIVSHLEAQPNPNSPLGVYTLRDPEVAAKYAIPGLDLPSIVSHRASDDYYGRFFDPRISNETPSKDEKGQAPASQQAKPETEITATADEDDINQKLANVANRVMGYAPGAQAPADDTQEAFVAMNFDS